MTLPIGLRRRALSGSQAPPEAIDAVYTWVDADDPTWQRRKEGALGKERRSPLAIDSRRHRYRNHDELRYSLRSLERFAPWVRKVFVVTSGQRPHWLCDEAPRIEVVSHESIFPDPDVLPTFNSHAIELNVHRIPGLSHRFLYLNDDVFFGRECVADDYLDAGHGVTYFERIRLDRDLSRDHVTDRACAWTADVVAGRLGRPRLTWMPAHVPQLYDRTLIEAIETSFADEFARTRGSRFRADDDFVLRIAYASLFTSRHQRPRLLDWGSEDYVFLRLRGSAFRRFLELAAVWRLRPKFLCLNDDLPTGWRGRLLVALMRSFLKLYFPTASGFERAPPSPALL
ncbi:Stealth CR1 domain-containing protein [Rubrivirga sp. IMCC43871]|uniref:stealth family protein n=1 Tax=Rubrivirga sp. IMCC43871 TaxID=3391575 RepID=UPI00398FECA7